MKSYSTDPATSLRALVRHMVEASGRKRTDMTAVEDVLDDMARLLDGREAEQVALSKAIAERLLESVGQAAMGYGCALDTSMTNDLRVAVISGNALRGSFFGLFAAVFGVSPTKARDAAKAVSA